MPQHRERHQQPGDDRDRRIDEDTNAPHPADRSAGDREMGDRASVDRDRSEKEEQGRGSEERRALGDERIPGSDQARIPGFNAPAEQHEQHTRKGQAQSPRELNHHEPPRHKEGHK